MKNGFSANFQNCVTCNFWTGPRSLNSTRTRAEYDAGVEGECLYGDRRILHKPPTAKCSNYQKWGILRSLSNDNTDNTRNNYSNNHPREGAKISYNSWKRIIFTIAIMLTGIVPIVVKFVKEHKEIIIGSLIFIIIFLLIVIVSYKKAKNKQNRFQSNTYKSKLQPLSSDMETQTDSFDLNQNGLTIKNLLEKPQKKRTTALLLLIFLGFFGVHRFYVGKIGTGILMILVTFITLGFGGLIWWIIDLICICTDKFKDKQGNELIK